MSQKSPCFHRHPFPLVRHSTAYTGSRQHRVIPNPYAVVERDQLPPSERCPPRPMWPYTSYASSECPPRDKKVDRLYRYLQAEAIIMIDSAKLMFRIYSKCTSVIAPPRQGTPVLDCLGIDFKKVENMPAFRDTYSLQRDQVECPIPNR